MKLAKVTLGLVSFFLFVMASGCGKKTQNTGKKSGQLAPTPADVAKSEGSEKSGAQDNAATPSGTQGGGDQASGATSRSPVDPCSVPMAGVSNNPRTIHEIVDLMNGLPKPLTLPCFLRSLPRPLEVAVSSNLFSAQPAFDLRNPRILIALNGLYLSIVPEGPDSVHLEVSEPTEPGMSIKGDFTFPITEQVSYKTPFESILSNTRQGTVCGGCHGYELKVKEVESVPVFTMPSLKINPSFDLTYASVYVLAQECKGQLTTRCDIIRSLFVGKPPKEHIFPVEMNSL